MLRVNNTQQVKSQVKKEQKMKNDDDEKDRKEKEKKERERRISDMGKTAFHGIVPEHIKRANEIKEQRRRKWCYEVERYRNPNESDTDFVKRMGEKDRGLPGRWLGEGRIPHPQRARSILEKLGVPPNEIERIMYGLTGEEFRGTGQAGYVYPDNNGPSKDGRIGFKEVFLKTNDIKPQSVKMVVCDTQSMFPEIRPRDFMLVDMSKTVPLSGKIYLIEMVDDPGTQIVCRLFALPNKEFSVAFDNKEVYPGYKVIQDLVLVHGEVVFVGRML